MTALAPLMDGLVDYAGLFPPAALPMDEAVHRYAGYRGGPDREMLGRFVVPADGLSALARARAGIARAASDVGPWPLAVLATAADAPAIASFEAVHGATLRVDTIEAKADDPMTIAALAATYPEYPVYVEIASASDPEPLIGVLAAQGLRAKLRMGGVVPEAFPAPEQVLRFLSACVRHRVPFKATAGLHHPLRGEFPLTYQPNCASGTMYGFLNVYLTALFLYAGYSADAVRPLLEERDPDSIVTIGDDVLWRGLRLDAGCVREARQRFVGAFGSCSFEEPAQELSRMILLPYLS
ncbi:MAG: hypothetical protein KF822_12600 [Steroidobacteraceae bacterium]|nr:hypothetical protein [Steroidobacteraceae bacterium]